MEKTFLNENELTEVLIEKIRKETRDYFTNAANEAKIEFAMKHKICPVCGSKIIQENIEQLEKPMGIFRQRFRKYAERWICEFDKEHFEQKSTFWG